MSAIFTVDPHSGVPIYLQLIAVVKRSVALGVLVPGEQLPTVKQLATTLTVNPNTVARSYRELERDGVIETSPGRGSFVRSNGSGSISNKAVSDVAAAAIDGAVREAKSIGLARADVAQLIDQVLDRWYPASDGREAS
jgi:GntR family transcriptional regulator